MSSRENKGPLFLESCQRIRCLIVLLLSALTAIGSFSLVRVKEAVREQARDALIITLKSTHQSIQAELLKSIRRVEWISREAAIQKGVVERLRGQSESEGIKAADVLLAATFGVNDVGAYGIFDMEHRLLFRSELDVISVSEMSLGVERALVDGLMGGNAFYLICDCLPSDYEERQGLVLVSPIATEGGVEAYLVVLLDHYRHFAAKIQTGRLGQSGVTFAFDIAGESLTKRPFQAMAIAQGLLRRVDARIVPMVPNPTAIRGGRWMVLEEHDATQHLFGHDVDGYVDSRGKQVLGAWIWDGVYQFGVSTEIEREEAFKTYRDTRRVVIMALGLSGVMALVIAWVLGQNAKRLRQMVGDRTEELERINEDLEREVKERKNASEQLMSTHEALQLAHQKLEHLAAIDALTGVANRRTFDQSLESEWRRCQRFGSPISLLIIDIDAFKAYNDTFGHQQGDRALRQVAQLISGTPFLRRPGDLVARYGGEEFAVILGHTHEAAALRIATTIIDRIKDARIDHPRTQVRGASVVTVSVGVACMGAADGGNWEDLLRRADQALYLAKANGRNRSASWHAEMPPVLRCN